MRVSIRHKNIEITPALYEYIDLKLVKPLEKFIKASEYDLPVFDIEVGRSTKHRKKGKVYRVTASLAMGKNILRAEAEEEDARAACDFLKDELEREIKKFKGKIMATSRRAARKIKKDLRLDLGARLYRKGRIREEGG